MDRTITVEGRSKLTAKPDTISLSMRLESVDTDYARAAAKASERLEALRTALEKAGFGRDDLKTSDFSVRAEYENVRGKNEESRREFRGYAFSQGLRLEFPLEMRRLGKAIEAVTSDAGNPNFSLEFTVKDREKLTEALLRGTAEDARRKALALAGASGAKLGALMSVSYGGGEPSFASPTNFRMAACMADAAAPDMNPEDVTLSDSATFVWALE